MRSKARQRERHLTRLRASNSPSNQRHDHRIPLEHLGRQPRHLLSAIGNLSITTMAFLPRLFRSVVASRSTISPAPIASSSRLTSAPQSITGALCNMRIRSFSSSPIIEDYKLKTKKSAKLRFRRKDNGDVSKSSLFLLSGSAQPGMAWRERCRQ